MLIDVYLTNGKDCIRAKNIFHKEIKTRIGTPNVLTVHDKKEDCPDLHANLAARHRHRACRGRCRCLRKKPRLPPGGGAVASATAAAAARGRS